MNSYKGSQSTWEIPSMQRRSFSSEIASDQLGSQPPQAMHYYLVDHFFIGQVLTDCQSYGTEEVVVQSMIRPQKEVVYVRFNHQ